MAKYKITLKRDAVLATDDTGNTLAKVEATTKEVIVTCKWCTEAVISAVKNNRDFYPVAWECIEADKKTPEEIAEEEKNKKILEEWKAKHVENLQNELTEQASEPDPS